MANALGREIEKGDIVVIAKKYLKSEYHELGKRLFECDGDGFGTSPDTMGHAVYGKYISDGEECRIEGYMISPKETKAYQKGLKGAK